MKLKKINVEGNINPMLLLGRESFDNWIFEIKELENQYKNKLENIKKGLSTMNRISLSLPTKEDYFNYNGEDRGKGEIFLSGDNDRGIYLYDLKGYGGYPAPSKENEDSVKSENIMVFYRATQKQLENFIKEREKEKRGYSCDKLNEDQLKIFENLVNKLYNNLHEKLLLKSAKINKDLFGRLILF